MYSCAITFAEDCKETNIGYRGICSNCYRELVKEGIIRKGDRFSDFPHWLQEMIRFEANEDTKQIRHPLEEYSDVIENKDTETRLYLGVEGCYKGRKMSTSVDFLQLKAVE